MRIGRLSLTTCFGASVIFGVLCPVGCTSKFNAYRLDDHGTLAQEVVLPSGAARSIPVYWEDAEAKRMGRPGLPDRSYDVIGRVSGQAVYLNLDWRVLGPGAVEPEFRRGVAALDGDAVIHARGCLIDYPPFQVNEFAGDVIRWNQ